VIAAEADDGGPHIVGFGFDVFVILRQSASQSLRRKSSSIAAK